MLEARVVLWPEEPVLQHQQEIAQGVYVLAFGILKILTRVLGHNRLCIRHDS